MSSPVRPTPLRPYTHPVIAPRCYAPPDRIVATSVVVDLGEAMKGRAFGLTVLGTLFLMAVFAIAGVVDADAVTYCVTNPACPAGGVGEPDLQTALSTAGTSTAVADTILLGPGTFVGTTSARFLYGDGGFATNDVTIQGAGPDQTTLTETDPALHVLDLSGSTGGADQDVRDLTVSLPPGFGASAVAGVLDATQMENVGVTAQGTVGDMATGVSAGGNGPFTGLDIRLPLTANPTGLYLDRPGTAITVTDSSITASRAMELTVQSRSTLERLRVHARTQGIASGFPDDGTHENVIEDSQITMDGSGFAIVAFPQSPQTDNATLALRHVTINGQGAAGSTGVQASSVSSNDSNVRVRNSIITGVEHPLMTTGAGSTLTASGSVLPPTGDTGTVTRVPGTNAEVADPLLVDAGNGDLYPRSDSPAIDLGDPGFTFNSLDLAGHSRVIDGNGDGNVLPDAGAFEYQRRAPSATATDTPPAVAGPPTTFTGVGTDPDPGDTLTYGWLFSDSMTSGEQSPSHVFGAGPFSATLTVTDPTGLTASSTLTGVVASAPIPPDTTPPVVSSVAFSPKTFRASVDTDTATSARRKPAGSTLRFKLSEPATVTITIAEKRSGRTKKSGGKSRCVAQTKKNRKAKRCTFYTTRATLTRKDLLAGSRSIQFTGRFKGKALKPASYRATVTAQDSAKNNGKAVTATFKVKKN